MDDDVSEGTPAARLIRRAREIAGITQTEMARRSGIAAPTISAYEAGRRDPTVTSLLRLLDAVGLDLSLQESQHAHRGRKLQDVLALASVLPRDDGRKPSLPSWNDMVRKDLRRGA